MKNKKRLNVGIRKGTRAAVIAALYVSLCIVFAPASSGPVQVRVSEALTLLAVFSTEAIVGVTIGCFLSNMIISAPIDMIVGTLATLIAGICTYRMRRSRVRGLAVIPSLPPIFINAVIVGAELTLLYFPAGSAPKVWLINMLSVGAGQIVSCAILGVPLVFFVERNPLLHKAMTQ